MWLPVVEVLYEQRNDTRSIFRMQYGAESFRVGDRRRSKTVKLQAVG
jgi:hypothetical protein